MEANVALLSLGSNLGERASFLESALNALVEYGQIVKCSSVYESVSWGFKSNDDFLNICIRFDTLLSPFDLLETIDKIETRLGRVREGDGYASRTIDIDIILFNSEVIDSVNLQIPHPYYRQRAFVLAPLAEISPEYRDPKDGQQITSLLKSCKDELPAKRNDIVLNY